MFLTEVTHLAKGVAAHHEVHAESVHCQASHQYQFVNLPRKFSLKRRETTCISTEMHKIDK